MLRLAMRHEGEPVARAFRDPKLVERRIVFLCDISGSMEPYARPMVMFLQAAVAAGRRIEAFTFGTRLTRLTPFLDGRDPERALERAGRAVPDWAGGTRIGESFKAFNHVYGRRGLTRGAIVVIASDGWERGDCTLLGLEMQTFHRRSRAVVWVNPLKGAAEYRPIAGRNGRRPPAHRRLPARPQPGRARDACRGSGEARSPIYDPARCSMNEDTLATIAAWVGEGQQVAVSQVVKTYRSAPRPIGSLFAVSSGGQMAGSVSGGCVEGAIYGEAQELFADPAHGPKLLYYGISDELAGEVGLACGGEIWVSLSLQTERPAIRRGAIVTAVTGPQAGRRLVVDDDRGAVEGDLEEPMREAAMAAVVDALAEESSRSLDLGAQGMLFIEAICPPPRLVIVGAVDTAEEVCKLARQLGWRTAVIDPRSKFATADRIPHADVIDSRWTDDAYPAVGLEAADHVIVLTHDPKVDDPAIAAALTMGCGYVGALGSRRTQALRKERLREAGVPQADLDRLYGPVGLDIGAHTPAETAVSIVAEVIGHRAGRTGRHLVRTSGRIHPTEEPE